MADILDWVKNPKGESNFELERNRIPEKIDSDKEIEDIQPEPEEDREEPHPRYHKKKLTKSIDSALDPSTYEEISYLNKHGHWYSGYIGPKSKKVTKKIFWTSDNSPNNGWRRLFDVIPTGRHTILFEIAINMETTEDAFDLLFDKDMLSFIEIKKNEKIRKRIEALTKHKEHLFESSKYPWIKPIDVSELCTLIGLIYYHGHYVMNHHSLSILFS